MSLYKYSNIKLGLAAIIMSLIVCGSGFAQIDSLSSNSNYKSRVLEATELDFLMSYYAQDGDNAAVTGGIGTEELTNSTPTIVVAIPLNDDSVLSIDAGISAYTSASSSNVNPFDGDEVADPYIASSGASKSDVLSTMKLAYSHSSDNRTTLWSVNTAIATEYDYFSIGFGGSFTKLFNQKNTELSANVNVYLDTWNAIYPSELRDLPSFTPFENESRNSFSFGLGFSQILSQKLQGSLALDVTYQEGLLSTPFQRVQFLDIPDLVIQNFTYADDIERLPNSRLKIAGGARLHYYVNEKIVLRSFYRFYKDDWNIGSHTASIEMPYKLTDKFTVYPSYRFYTQSAADYFAAFNKHVSTQTYYTSDYDLSEFKANQFGLGISYTDIFTKLHILSFGLKKIEVAIHNYERDSGLTAFIVSGGLSFVLE
ncbi:DUF3570 domain-containing protein [Aquimarina sp. W85]|uniref:DUF3570 domain-containing protein n=1 Tax=Aquimarina rhodophyticola TaxID=3342246 RepID=UPI0036700383